MKRTVTLLLSIVLLQFISNASANWSLLGNFDPGRGNDQDRQTAMDAWAGKQHSVQLLFCTFDQQETTWLWLQMVNIWNTGHIPIISWQPWFEQKQTPSNIEVQVSNGQYDTYINSWGSQLKNFLAGPDGKMDTADDRRAYMRFAHEFNGNWYPWSAKTGESTPADYVNMWRRVKNLIGNLGIDKNHLQWIWSGICCEAGDFKLEQYFPGNDYIDWIGMGGMNFGTSVGWSNWRPPLDLFPDMVRRMRAITNGEKPLGITEYTSVSDGGGVGGKNVWITNFFQYCQDNNIRMTSYFNLDKDESGGMKDWAVFGGMRGDETYTRNGRTFNAYSAYRKAVGNNPFFVGTDKSNSKMVRDEYFFGTGTCDANEDCLTGYTCSAGLCVRPGSAPSNAPASASPSNPASAAPSKQPVNSQPAPSNAPASASPSAPSKPVNDTTKPTTCPDYMVYNTNVVPRMTSWGSRGSNFLLNILDATAPKGGNAVQINTNDWAGFGIFYEQQGIDMNCYTRVKFSLKSTTTTKFEIQDIEGKNKPVYIESTNNQWTTKSIQLNYFLKDIDVNKLNGLFLLTMEHTGSFAVNNIVYTAA